jgi:hypothetical protein
MSEWPILSCSFIINDYRSNCWAVQGMRLSLSALLWVQAPRLPGTVDVTDEALPVPSTVFTTATILNIVRRPVCSEPGFCLCLHTFSD